MPTKSLKGVDRSIKIETGNGSETICGRMAERHVRSVHREACRPQGNRSPQRQFSPVKSVDAGDDGVNVLEVNTASSVIGEFEAGPSGFEAVACMQRSDLELGRARRFPPGYVHPTNGRMGK